MNVLSKDVIDHVPVHVGLAIIATLVFVSESRVIDAQQA
jgi:hypothetical protein